MASRPNRTAAMPSSTAAGYSGTPQAGKLGYKSGTRAYLAGAPPDYSGLLEPLPDGVVFEAEPGRQTDLAHIFVREPDELAVQLAWLRVQLRADAVLWVSWPKKSSKMPSTVVEDTVRELALPLGWVDVKVCAVSEIWSGLKLVVRKGLR